MSGGDHEHARDWRAQLEQMRAAAAHHYEHRFDWRGHQPPASFSGPRYFPPAERWRVAAWLDTATPGTGDHVTLPTSTGKLREMTIAGQLVFEADGREQRLTAYLTHGHGEAHELFVPFRDATSGQATYGSGRYLDVPYLGEDGEYLLDFNLAYNPSCSYDPRWACPLSPPANRLPIPVRAGERHVERPTR